MTETEVLAPEQDAVQRRRRMIESLRQAGKISREQASVMLTQSPQPLAPLDDELEIRGYLSGAESVRALADYYGYRSAEMPATSQDLSVATELPAAVCLKYEVVPIAREGDFIVVAMTDPADIVAEEVVRRASAARVEFVVAAQSAVQRRIEQLYSTEIEAPLRYLQADADDVVQLDTTATDDISLLELERGAEKVSTIRMANQILAEAAQRGASDLHLEPQDSFFLVRLRIDGVIVPCLTLPKSVQPALVSRFKIMGEMDIADSRRPQDGHCRVSFNRRVLDLRLSTIPTQYGETMVIRLLDQSRPLRGLEDLEFRPENQARLRELITLPQGLVLVTGPTGSGKSTTLYTCVSVLQRSNKNIVTVEDPVEREIPGVNQVSVNERAGVTFANSLRSILRQDPNVIMIGEIRDVETAQMAIQASLTGHMVLSTLHTNDAASTITRLLEMGVPAHLLASGLAGIVAQRLVRRICSDCRGLPPAVAVCGECGGDGFRGRIAVAEVLQITPALRTLIAKGATAGELASAAKSEGMSLLPEDARARVGEGVTTFEEASLAIDLAPPTELPSVAAGSPSVPISSPYSTALMEAPPAAGPVDPALLALAPRILVCEDDAVTRAFLTRTLENNFYRVIEAVDGLDGVTRAVAEVPDLIITDIDMPNLNGFELCRHVRTHLRTRHIPVLMLTAQDSEDYEVRGLEVGADDYIPKPIRAKSVLARIQAVLRRNS